MPELPCFGLAFVRKLCLYIVRHYGKDRGLLVIPLLADDIVEVADLVLDGQRGVEGGKH